MSPSEIVALRRQLKLTARRFAEALGVDADLVFDWEKGERFPTKRHCDAMDALRAQHGEAAGAPASVDPWKRLNDPTLWAVVRKLAASEELFEQVRKLAAEYPDPVED